VLKVKGGVRYEVGDSVRYEAAFGTAIGRIIGFPSGGGGDDGEQHVEMFEMRKPANGHPREVMVNSMKKLLPASSLRGRVIVLGKADFERRVYASRDGDIYFSRT
jgi:hypothetical protein